MRKRPHRHPVLEAVVFAAALLMAGFVGRELYRRWQARPRPAAVTERPDVVIPTAVRPSVTALPAKSTTQESVTSVPPLKLTRIQPRRKKPVVPAPR